MLQLTWTSGRTSGGTPRDVGLLGTVPVAYVQAVGSERFDVETTLPGKRYPHTVYPTVAEAQAEAEYRVTAFLHAAGLTTEEN
jgi:hypothetical protein